MSVFILGAPNLEHLICEHTKVRLKPCIVMRMLYMTL